MSEFEKELESILEKIGEYYQGITTGNVLEISKHFKDWQPPKPLVVVPQFVADWFEKNDDDLSFKIWGYLINWKLQDKKSDFFRWMKKESECIEILIRMQDGYTVEKEPKFSLVNKITGEYLVLPAIKYRIKNENIFDNSAHCEKDDLPKWKPEMYQFTEVEITSMETGSYEQSEVEP